MKRQAIVLGGLLALLAMIGCDSDVAFDRDNEIVVEGYLVTEHGFGQIRLSRTQPVESVYDFAAAALRDAIVRIRRIGPGGEAEETIGYDEDPGRPGVYLAQSGEIVRPLATYELLVEVPATGEVLSSRTTVPGSYSVIDAGRDTLVYQSGEQAEVLITRSEYPGRAAIFVFSVEALDPGIANLTPFYLDVVDPDNDADEDELEDYLINESPILNEEGYEQVSDNVLRIRVPWLSFAFYGRNLLRSNAIDDNLYDFLRSQAVQQGGSTFSPGEIPNILDRVEGGTGIFGSYSVVQTEVFLKRAPGA